MLAGAGWNLLNLWALAHLLGAWIGPRRSLPRALGWGLIKIPLLYALVFWLMSQPVIPPVAFAIGFTTVLVTVMLRLVAQPLQLAASGFDGR